MAGWLMPLAPQRRQALALLLLLLPLLLNPLAGAAFSLLPARAFSCPPRAGADTAARANSEVTGGASQARVFFEQPSGAARLVASRDPCLRGTRSSSDVIWPLYATNGLPAGDAVGRQKLPDAPARFPTATARASADSSSCSNRKRHLVIVDWSDKLVPYELAWFAQHALLQHQLLQLDSQQQQQQSQQGHVQREQQIEVLPGVAPRRVAGSTACDFAILTQHSSVYTLGQGSKLSFVGDGLREMVRQLLLPEELQQMLQGAQGVKRALQEIGDLILPLRGASQSVSREDPPELLRVERGGEVTWHGPGQLVLYPIFDLRNHRTDVRMYIEALENVAAKTLISLWKGTQPSALSLQQQQQEEDLPILPRHPQHQQPQQETLSPSALQLTRERSMPGVWAAGKKICAVGVRLRRWVSFHGLALNIDNSLSHYRRIVACGLEGKEPTNARDWLHLFQHQHPLDHLPVKGQHPRPLLKRAARALIEAVVNVFGFSSLAVTPHLSEALELHAAPPIASGG